MSELVSVIVPIYKVENYINKCIDSILNQSYENLEIILVDDGSPDNCGQICDEYAKRDSRIRVIHKQNGGLSSARNAALDVMTGDWVVCVDSDDHIAEDMVEKLIKAAHEYQADMVISSYYEEKGGKLNITDKITDKPLVMDRETALKKLVEDQEIKNYAWGKLYRAEYFQGVRYPNGRNYEDIPTTYLLFDKCAKIVKIPEYLYIYLIRDDSISFNNSPSSWHKGCHAACIGYEERAEYFKEKGYNELYDMSMGKLLPYLYSDIRSAYRAGAHEDAALTMEYIREHRKAFEDCKHASDKDKKLINVYLKDRRFYETYENVKKPLLKINKNAKKLLSLVKNSGNYDFSLQDGKTKRIIFFELPGFDNLGDHALSYVTHKLLQDYIEMSGHDDCQLFVVDGWKTHAAVRALKKQIGQNDVIISQGGGNFGSLYEFSEVFRRKIMAAFPNNKIIIMPQTVFYTEDEKGQKELALDTAAIKRCSDITIFARDHKSFELFEQYFGPGAKVRELHDTVSLYDANAFSCGEREDILLCLRSDKESNLSAEDKFAIFDMCRGTGHQFRVTDTCTNYEIRTADRQQVLEDKFKLWGSARLVITDRLHGMIFSVITGTPCIVLGNNHYKVMETYKTFEACPYLRYAESLADIPEYIKALEAFNTDTAEDSNFNAYVEKDIELLYRVISYS